MAKCRSCPVEVVWCCHVDTGRAAPIERATADDGNIVIARDKDGEYVYRILTDTELAAGVGAGRRHLNHFARCPAAASHHKTPPR